jgi:hypothetical protein
MDGLECAYAHTPTRLKPQVCFYISFICTLLMILCRLLLWLPPAASSIQHHTTTSRGPTLAANASRWAVFPRQHTHNLNPTLAPKASRWGYFLNPFTRQVATTHWHSLATTPPLSITTKERSGRGQGLEMRCLRLEPQVRSFFFFFGYTNDYLVHI